MYCVCDHTPTPPDLTTAAQPHSNWATSLHHMAPFSVHALWIQPAPEEFCASVPVQLWGVPVYRGARGWGVGGQCNYIHCWLIQQSFNTVANHTSEIFISNLTKRWKMNESLFFFFFMGFQIFKDCVIKFTWELHLMCAQSITVLFSGTSARMTGEAFDSKNPPSTILRISPY